MEIKCSDRLTAFFSVRVVSIETSDWEEAFLDVVLMSLVLVVLQELNKATLARMTSVFPVILFMAFPPLRPCRFTQRRMIHADFSQGLFLYKELAAYSFSAFTGVSYQT